MKGKILVNNFAQIRSFTYLLFCCQSSKSYTLWIINYKYMITIRNPLVWKMKKATSRKGSRNLISDCFSPFFEWNKNSPDSTQISDVFGIWKWRTEKKKDFSIKLKLLKWFSLQLLLVVTIERTKLSMLLKASTFEKVNVMVLTQHCIWNRKKKSLFWGICYCKTERKVFSEECFYRWKN